MEPLLYVIIGLLALVAVALLVLAIRQRGGKPTVDSLGQLQQQLADSLGQQDKRIGLLSEQLTTAIQNLTANTNTLLTQNQTIAHQSQKSTSERLDAVGKTIGNLNTQLGQLGQATQNILQVGGEVRKLQDILQSPKLRGGLGEWSLENLLSEILPRQHYHLQHRFSNGQIVDALIELTQGKVCIDAKFPLPNFQLMLEAQDETARTKAKKEFLRDVKKHIDAISEKYIAPDEGTLDFALMYIPAENVYYETILISEASDLNVSDYGRKKKVVPVSPNLLYSYLMVIATGLQGLQIENNAKKIYQHLSRLDSDLVLLNDDFQTLGKHLTNAKTKYDDTGKKLDHFGLKLRSLENHESVE
jgi:DNA recombination protein RmuC